jgi:hypothetical protein
MNAPGGRKPPIRPRSRRDDATIPNLTLTDVLNTRVRREVALEKAAEPEPHVEDDVDVSVDVVLGADGVPQIADEAEHAPDRVGDVGHGSRKSPRPPPKR